MLSKNKAKYIRSLHLKKNRVNEGIFIAEGKKIVSEMLTAGAEITELLASADFIEQNRHLISDKIQVTVIAAQELKTISLLQEPDDALALCRFFANTPHYDSLKNDLAIYLDGIRDPGNFGTIIRVCDWFGIKNIFCSPDTTELYNPKTVQSTMGSFLRVNIFYESLESLKEKAGSGLPVYGAYMEGENIFTLKLLPAGILVIGNEANGISESVSKNISRKLSIPAHQKGGPESLNAAIATSILVAEYRRINY